MLYIVQGEGTSTLVQVFGSIPDCRENPRKSLMIIMRKVASATQHDLYILSLICGHGA